MKVTVDGVGVEIDGQPILTDVTLEAPSGRFHGLVGPNGSGKSTLLRCLYRSQRLAAGSVRFGDDDLWRSLSTSAAARCRAVVTQDSGIDMDFTARDVVAMGRFPHKGMFGRDDADDREIITSAMDSVDMAWAADRSLLTLSGGERQRVLIARALAQQAPILLLDEPTNHLDVRAQVELLDFVKSLGLTTIAALHDLDQAVSLCDEVTVLSSGRVVASGTPDAVLTPPLVRRVFGVDAHVGTHPLTGRPHLTVAALAPVRPE